MAKVLNKRGTRTQLNTAAAANKLSAGEVYLITDENRLAVGLTTSTYETYAKASEAGGGGGGSFSELAKIYNFVGTLSTKVGISRWYPERNITLKSAYINVGVAHTSDTLIANVLKNGTQLFSVNLSANSFKSDVSILNDLPVLTTDYLTVNIVATGGVDMTITITYL